VQKDSEKAQETENDLNRADWLVRRADEQERWGTSLKM
jgi:hypothetical protein